MNHLINIFKCFKIRSGTAAMFVGFIVLAAVIGCGSQDKKEAETKSEFCLTACAIPLDASLTFTQKLRIKTDGCNLSNVELFDAASHLQIFYIAQCTTTTQLFTTPKDYSLTSPDGTRIVSVPCALSKGKVTAANIAEGDGGFLVIHICLMSDGLSTVYMSKLAPDGAILTTVTLDSGRNLSPPWVNLSLGFTSRYVSQWNGGAGAWGVIGNSSFRRFDSQLTQIGLAQPWLEADSNDIVLDGEEWIAGNYRKLTRYTRTGAVGCNNESNFSGFDQVFLFKQRRLDKRQLVLHEVVNSVSCGITGQKFGGVLPVNQTLDIDSILKPFQLNTNYSVIPFTRIEGETKILMLGMLTNSTIPEYAAIVSVAENVNVSPHVFTIGNNRVYAAYLRNNEIVISMNGEDI